MHNICSKLLYAAIIAGLIAAFIAPSGSAKPVRQIARAAVLAR